MSSADLTGAKLVDANLTNALLTNANLTNVTYDARTKWPATFMPPPSRCYLIPKIVAPHTSKPKPPSVRRPHLPASSESKHVPKCIPIDDEVETEKK